jgi:hypothetical protein
MTAVRTAEMAALAATILITSHRDLGSSCIATIVRCTPYGENLK